MDLDYDCASASLYLWKQLVVHCLKLLSELCLELGICWIQVPISYGQKWVIYSCTKKIMIWSWLRQQLGQSLPPKAMSSTRDLIILVDVTIRKGLEASRWKVGTIKRTRNPKAEQNAYNGWNYSKFRLWQLTDYDKIIFIDVDPLILRNIDFLFSMPEITTTGNNATLFNSGVMVWNSWYSSSPGPVMLSSSPFPFFEYSWYKLWETLHPCFT